MQGQIDESIVPANVCNPNMNMANVCLSVYMYVCMYVGVYVCMHVYMYI